MADFTVFRAVISFYVTAMSLSKSAKVTEAFYLNIADYHQKHGNIEKAVGFLKAGYEEFKNSKVLTLKFFLKYIDLLNDVPELEKVLETTFTHFPQKRIALALLEAKRVNKTLQAETFEMILDKVHCLGIAKSELDYLLETGTSETKRIQDAWFLKHLKKFDVKFSCDYIRWTASTFGVVKSREAFLTVFKIQPSLQVLNCMIALETQHQQTPYVIQTLIRGRYEIFGPADPGLMMGATKQHFMNMVIANKLAEEKLDLNSGELKEFRKEFEKMLVYDCSVEKVPCPKAPLFH